MLIKHVDDLLLVGPARAVRNMLDMLMVHLLMKDTPFLELGQEVKHLGRIIVKKPYGFTLRSRGELFDSLFEAAGLEGANPTALPGTKTDAYNDEARGTPLNEAEYSLYRKMIGKPERAVLPPAARYGGQTFRLSARGAVSCSPSWGAVCEEPGPARW